LQWIDAPHLGLTLDIGHLWCQGELPLADAIARWGPRIVNVHIEDMRAGVHEHLMFGEGEIQFPPVLEALARAGYRGPLHVELSRHSHEAPQAAQRAYDFLSPLVQRLRAA
jgi:sugar phosphate isomerase/epimerase